jgi:hypothetical protein
MLELITIQQRIDVKLILLILVVAVDSYTYEYGAYQDGIAVAYWHDNDAGSRNRLLLRVYNGKLQFRFYGNAKYNRTPWYDIGSGVRDSYTYEYGAYQDGIAVAYWHDNDAGSRNRLLLRSLAVTTLVCPSGGYNEYGNSTQCRKQIYANVPTVWNGLTLSNNAVSNADAYIKTPSCLGSNMSVTPFYPTPHYGNNGLCYSDVGLYCKQTGVSWDGIYTCFNTNLTCNDSSLRMDLTKDKCEKYTYSCDAGKNRYGLAEHQTDNDATVLFNRISDPHTKLNSISSLIIAGDVDVNDNNGAMCVENKTSTFSQGSTAGTYTIDGDSKSGF